MVLGVLEKIKHREASDHQQATQFKFHQCNYACLKYEILSLRRIC